MLSLLYITSKHGNFFYVNAVAADLFTLTSVSILRSVEHKSSCTGQTMNFDCVIHVLIPTLFGYF